MTTPLEPDGPSAVKRWLEIEPLTKDAFTPYGQVIAADGEGEPINRGTSMKFADLCTVEVDQGARVALHIYRAQPTTLPSSLCLLERHPLASQAFVPVGQLAFVVVVAGAGQTPRKADLRAFLTDGHQGIQLATGVWHHPLLAIDAGDLLVVDRHCANPEESARNLELIEIQDWHCWLP